MHSELEELVSFLGSSQPHIQQLALEHAVGYSVGPHAHVFAQPSLKPVQDLKVLVRDIPSRAKQAITILINLCENGVVVNCLVDDPEFIKLLIMKVTSSAYPNADEVAMLLANISKSPKMRRLFTMKRDPPGGVSRSSLAIDQLIDCFVSSPQGGLNKHAHFDYLAYVFANLSTLEEGRRHFMTKQAYDDVVPISKLVVFTEHRSNIRRKGTASTIKNCCFKIDLHANLLAESEVNILPYILLPLMGSEEYSDEDMEGMPDELQLLPPDKEREADPSIIVTYLEALLLLTTTRGGRDRLRQKKIYPVIREIHLAVESEDVRIACDRVVQVLMRDEANELGEDDELTEVL